MNCQLFENIASDLARGLMMDAAMLDDALAHAEDCEKCGARLADERALTAGLRAMAESMEPEQAPARVEEALLAAFRERAAGSPAAVIAIVPANKQNRARRFIAAAAAAAAILILAALVATRLQSAPPIEEARKDNNAPPPQVVVPPQPQAPEPVVQPEDEKQAAEKPVPRRREKPRRAPLLAGAKKDKGGQEQLTADDEIEIATDFLPLDYGNNMIPMDGGKLMRVELPRSVLISFGLPMNPERIDEPIVADVLVGHDGVAHAIRFLR